MTYDRLISAESGDRVVKGPIDVFRNGYTISGDPKVGSNPIESMLFRYFVAFTGHFRNPTSNKIATFPYSSQHGVDLCQ